MKIGDRVFLTFKDFLATNAYPVINTVFECPGTIIDIEETKRLVVQWDNRSINVFNKVHLTLLKDLKHIGCRSIWRN